MARNFVRLGSQVRIIEERDRIMSRDHPDALRLMMEVFRREEPA